MECESGPPRCTDQVLVHRMSLALRIRAVVIPAAVFQSVIFGGAYGTGREVAEFVSAHGPVGGLLALAQTAVSFAIILALSFEVARLLDAYDYRSFFKGLIGRGWIAYELLAIASIPLVVAVNAAAAGSIVADQLHLPYVAGVVAAFVAVALLSYLGRNAVERSLVFLALGLFAVLAATIFVIAREDSEKILGTFASYGAIGEWQTSALKYSLYNLAIVPVILYCARDLKSTAESIGSGIAAGIAGVLPAIVFHVAFMADYPAILEEPLPVYFALKTIANPVLLGMYIFVLVLMIFSTLIGLLQGLNERLDAWHIERTGQSMTSPARVLVSTGVMLISLLLSGFGITALIAQGYGSLAWAYLVVFILPLSIVGPVLLYRRSHRAARGNAD